jgi:hypothetical protein
MKSILAAVPILLVAACGPRVEQVPIAQVVPPPPMEQRIVVPPPSPLYAPPPGPEARPRVHRSHRVRRTHEMLVRTQLSRCPPGLHWRAAYRTPAGAGLSRTVPGRCVDARGNVRS